MKPYKYKRKLDEQRKKNPTKNLRRQKLIQFVREVTIDEFNGTNSMYWFGEELREEVDIFGALFYHKATDWIDNLTYPEVVHYYPLYQRCVKKLEEKKRKAEFMNKVYVPLADDLFNIV